ncbi:MAG: twitching motility protein PilT [Chloroflexi bacterium]|nr:twitching motility protein PilT [Chloroflexota bacterium]MDL1944162.1 type II toxin-antitoxin system VapC family toxin [Chloroflexi bacterium CFX2]
MRCVLDASVGIKLFIEEEFSDKVERLFSKLAEDPQAEIHVPDLFYIECANILLKYTRRHNRLLEDSLKDIADLNDLALKSTSTSELIEEALELAHEKNLTAYDACYAVLARQLALPLVTADAPLARAVDWAVWIGDFEV